MLCVVFDELMFLPCKNLILDLREICCPCTKSKSFEHRQSGATQADNMKTWILA